MFSEKCISIEWLKTKKTRKSIWGQKNKNKFILFSSKTDQSRILFADPIDTLLWLILDLRNFLANKRNCYHANVCVFIQDGQATKNIQASDARGTRRSTFLRGMSCVMIHCRFTDTLLIPCVTFLSKLSHMPWRDSIKCHKVVFRRKQQSVNDLFALSLTVHDMKSQVQKAWIQNSKSYRTILTRRQRFSS